MINADVIEQIYKQYSKKPKSVDCLDFATLFDKAGEHHDLLIDPEKGVLIIGSIAEDAPFHSIPLRNIIAFVPFEEWVAIVMHSSIIFLNSRSSKVAAHIKPLKESLWDKICN